MSHASNNEVIRALVFLKEAMAVCSLMGDSELDEVSAEIKNYSAFGGMDDDAKVGAALGEAIKFYKEGK